MANKWRCADCGCRIEADEPPEDMPGGWRPAAGRCRIGNSASGPLRAAPHAESPHSAKRLAASRRAARSVISSTTAATCLPRRGDRQAPTNPSGPTSSRLSCPRSVAAAGRLAASRSPNVAFGQAAHVEPPCIAVCPAEAISMRGDVAWIDPECCDGDGVCIPACPEAAIVLPEELQS